MSKPSRILNDDNLFFGLDRNDIMSLGVVFYIFQGFLSLFGWEGFSLFATAIVAAFLVQIRLRFRRKIIRDTTYFYYYQFVRGGIYYDPQDYK